MIQVFRRHGFIYDQLPAILWASLIFIASSSPSITIPKLEFVPSDKIIHLVVYLVLCALIYRALLHQQSFPRLSRWSLVCCVLLSIAYGVSDEYHQSFVPNRDSSVHDLLADSLGALIFFAFAFVKERAAGKRPV